MSGDRGSWPPGQGPGAGAPGAPWAAQPQVPPQAHVPAPVPPAGMPGQAGAVWGPGPAGPPGTAGPSGTADGTTDDQGTKRMVLRLARVVVTFVYVVVAACVAFLVTGFVLRLFGASTDAAFTRWVYRNVDRIMEPFRGIFPTHAVSDQSVLDVSLLFAIIVYALIAMGLHALVAWLARAAARADAQGRRRVA